MHHSAHADAVETHPSQQLMRYGQLGSTSLRPSIIGFGASPLGDVFGRTDPVETRAAVHFAIDNGINFFDVSPYYGLTLAESRLGDAIHDRRDEVILATKCGRNGAADFDFSAASVRASVEASLVRLRTDRIDLLQVHDTEFGSSDQIVNETLPTLRDLQREGKARYIGITGYSLTNLMSIASRFEVDSLLTYCRYNLLIDDIDAAFIPFAKQHNLGVINASPLHMGLLAPVPPPSWHPAPPEVHEAARQVRELCRDYGVDTPQLALRFCMDHLYVSSTLIGMSTREQVAVNLEAVSLAANPNLLAAISNIVEPVVHTTWPSGLPENYD